MKILSYCQIQHGALCIGLKKGLLRSVEKVSQKRQVLSAEREYTLTYPKQKRGLLSVGLSGV